MKRAKMEYVCTVVSVFAFVLGPFNIHRRIYPNRSLNEYRFFFLLRFVGVYFPKFFVLFTLFARISDTFLYLTAHATIAHIVSIYSAQQLTKYNYPNPSKYQTYIENEEF